MHQQSQRGRLCLPWTKIRFHFDLPPAPASRRGGLLSVEGMNMRVSDERLEEIEAMAESAPDPVELYKPLSIFPNCRSKGRACSVS